MKKKTGKKARPVSVPKQPEHPAIQVFKRLTIRELGAVFHFFGQEIHFRARKA